MPWRIAKLASSHLGRSSTPLGHVSVHAGHDSPRVLRLFRHAWGTSSVRTSADGDADSEILLNPLFLSLCAPPPRVEGFRIDGLTLRTGHTGLSPLPLQTLSGRVDVRVWRRNGTSHGGSPTDESLADSLEYPAAGLKNLSKRHRSEPHLLTRPRPEIIFQLLTRGFQDSSIDVILGATMPTRTKTWL